MAYVTNRLQKTNGDRDFCLKIVPQAVDYDPQAVTLVSQVM